MRYPGYSSLDSMILLLLEQFSQGFKPYCTATAWESGPTITMPELNPIHTFLPKGQRCLSNTTTSSAETFTQTTSPHQCL